MLMRILEGEYIAKQMQSLHLYPNQYGRTYVHVYTCT